jgi:hypothetical protein
MKYMEPLGISQCIQDSTETVTATDAQVTNVTYVYFQEIITYASI